MLSKIRSDRGIYLATPITAVVILLTAFGFLPKETMFFAGILLSLYVLTLTPRLGLKFFILLLPWFFAVPITAGYDHFQIWRILIAEIAVLALWKEGFKLKLSKIDYAFFAFLIIGLLSGGVAGLKYIIWLFNIYLVSVVSRIIIKDQNDKAELIRTAAASVITLVVVGFTQLLAYLFTPQLLFWQYWASTIIPVLYGSDLASVLNDFNSWFSYFKEGPPGLRMFSLLPGSHYLALVGALGLAFVLRARELAENKTKWNWFTGLVILSLVFTSVRGVWIGAIAPVVVATVLFLIKKFSKPEFKKAIIPFVIFLVLFLASPVLNKIFVAVSPHNQGVGSLFTRAGSSFDPYETSNNMRLELWKISWESIKQNPTLGLGFGNFPLVFGNPLNKSVGELAEENDPIVGIPKKHVSAHNVFLQVLTESGFLGLAAFLAFLYYVFSALWKSFRENESSFALFFAVCLIWVLGQEMFDMSFLANDKTLILFWLGLSLR